MAVFLSDEEQLTIIASSRKEFREIELLLLSRYIPHQLESGLMVKRFYVPRVYEERARQEIETYQAENKNWPPKISIPPKRPFRISILHFVVILGLSYFHWMTSGGPDFETWLEVGKLSADKALGGEWHRIVTSLTLHLDDSHFLSNLLALIFFTAGVDQFLGGGVAWLLVVISAAVGNYFNALFYQTAHNAVGASTAVFAAVGLLGALGIKDYYKHREIKKRFFIPVIGALGLFAMLGTNPESDVMAHFFGFISGLGIGIIILPVKDLPFFKKGVAQIISFGLFLAIIYYCWQIQLGIGQS